MSRSAGTILLFAGLAAAAVWLLLRDPLPAAPIATGQPAPGFALPRVGAEGELRLADLRGQVVLVNFWATWCKPCEDEMPAMERLHQSLEGRAFELVAVSVDEGPDEVVAFQERLGLSFPIVLDVERDVARDYQSFKFPETFLIDAEGVLVARYIGPRDWDAPEYQARIERLLGEGS